MIERRAGRFTERLSLFLVITSALGGFLILVDPQITAAVPWGTLKFGSDGFSSELKGAVVTLMLIGGFTAVKEFWLGASAGGQKQADSMARIAEGKVGVPSVTTVEQTGASSSTVTVGAAAAPSENQPTKESP